MLEQIDTEVEGISEEESVDQNTSADPERNDFDNEELTSGNVNMEKENLGSADDSYFSEEIRAEGGLVINMAQVQSIDIPEQFSQKQTKEGW